MTVRERIKLALERSGKSQNDLATYLKVKQGSVSGVLNRGTEFDSLKYLEATSSLTGYRFEWLRTGAGPELISDATSMVEEPPLKSMAAKVNAEVRAMTLESELNIAHSDVQRLMFENKILREALREIGAGAGEVLKGKDLIK